MKLIVFDLDGTLAPVGCPIGEKVLSALRELEARGFRIALCSGKPAYYLCGVMRQAGLKSPVLLGENGACMQQGIDLPPENSYTLPCSRQAKESIRILRGELERRMPELWFQPNQVGLTPFFRTRQQQQAIGQCIADLSHRLQDVDIYPQGDCYDITPRGINKAAGIRALGEYLNIAPADMIAVGDGINDYPMFAAVGFSIGIRLSDPAAVDLNVSDIEEAMEQLLQLPWR